MDELAKALLPVAIDLARDYAMAQSDAEREEARRKAERATSDAIKLWEISHGTHEPTIPIPFSLPQEP